VGNTKWHTSSTRFACQLSSRVKIFSIWASRVNQDLGVEKVGLSDLIVLVHLILWLDITRHLELLAMAPYHCEETKVSRAVRKYGSRCHVTELRPPSCTFTRFVPSYALQTYTYTFIYRNSRGVIYILLRLLLDWEMKIIGYQIQECSHVIGARTSPHVIAFLENGPISFAMLD
jgi:hypothetical protein